MYISSSVVVLVPLLASLSSAVDIIHWNQPGCGGSKMGCWNVPANICCAIGKPFVKSTTFENLVNPSTVKQFGGKKCSGVAPIWEMTYPPDNWFCSDQNIDIDFGGLAGMWINGIHWRKVRSLDGRAAAAAALADRGHDDHGGDDNNCVEPNFMGYTDDDGNSYEILIPLGKAQEVTTHFVAGNFTALARYPPWEK